MFSKVAELAATAREPGTGVPSEIARTLPEELRRLVGRKRGAVGLGNVDDARGPIDCLYGLPSVQTDYYAYQRSAHFLLTRKEPHAPARD